MKGFELCRRFYEEIGRPRIQAELPECQPYIAVGLSGGSQSHGNDDEQSRDHAWGPGFTVWLPEDSFHRYAESLQSLLDQLPGEFLGYGWHGHRDHTCGVIAIDDYVRSCVGCERPPAEPIEWIRIPEAYLYELTPSRLFLDELGELTERFEAFSQYPEDVWKHRLCGGLAWCGEWGEKHLARAERRGEATTTLMYAARFEDAAMRAVFLLNRRYAPYHKWLHREFLKLPQLADHVAPWLDRMLFESEGRADAMYRVQTLLMEELEDRGYSPIEPSEKELRHMAYVTRIRPYIRSIRATIEDEKIRRLNSFFEIRFPPTKATWGYIHPHM